MANNEAQQFEQLVLAAVAEIPPEFTGYLRDVEVLIERRPSRAHRRMLGLRPWHTIYGCYDGVPLSERSSQLATMPDIITIFQEPLERDFPRPSDLRAEVRRTVLHELAHVFGISDERLRELDAY